MNSWIRFVKTESKKRGLSYACAITDPNIQLDYRNRNKPNKRRPLKSILKKVKKKSIKFARTKKVKTYDKYLTPNDFHPDPYH